MGQFMSTVQVKLKGSSEGLLLSLVRIYSGLILGLTFALVGEEILGYGSLSFTFVVVTITALFLKVSKNWGWAPLLVFDLICVLVGLLLRMYVLIAPGA